MALVVKLNKWANAHTNFYFDGLRIALGIFIFYKGLFFITQTNYLMEIFKPLDASGTFLFLVHYVAMVHFTGGLFIAIGLLTRLSAILQLPILLGAVVINFIGPMEPINLVQALISFLLCAFFVVYGSGKHSLDYGMKLNT